MRILLISDLPPCSNHTSGLLIDRLCDYLLDNGHEVSAYIVKADVVQVEIPQNKIDRMTFDLARKPRENWGAWKLGRLGSVLGDLFVTSAQIPRILRRITSFAEEMQAELIWAPVQGQTMARLIRPAAERIHVPYVVQVFDPINWWFQANAVDGWTQKRVMKEFGRMIHGAQCFIGASPNMATVYAAQYSCRNSVPIMMPFDAAKTYVSKRVKRTVNTFVIALAGQLYAYGTIMSLLVSLNSIKWSYRGKKIIFRVYGANMHFDIPVPCFMEYRGWVPQEELLEELAEADLLYCPYRFDPDFEETARLSFPGKLSTYMRTGVPILVHSPEYAGITHFIRERQCGYILESVVMEDIVNAIQTIMDDQPNLNYSKTALDVSDRELSLQAMYKNFAQALGIPLHDTYMGRGKTCTGENDVEDEFKTRKLREVVENGSFQL